MNRRSIAAWSRRRFGIAAAAFATALLDLSPNASVFVAARKGKKKRPRLNAFGCLNVGQKCRGKSERCCSGICQGKKPKKGKRDRSRCVAHDVGPCTEERDNCVSATGTCNPARPFSRCFRTTGAASFCGDSSVGGCIACRKDADCVALEFGANSACVVCESCPGEDATACISSGL